MTSPTSCRTATELQQQLRQWNAKPIQTKPIKNKAPANDVASSIIILKLDVASKQLQQVPTIEFDKKQWFPSNVKQSATATKGRHKQAAANRTSIIVFEAESTFTKPSTQQLANAHILATWRARMLQLPSAVENSERALQELARAIVEGGDSADLSEVGAVFLESWKLRQELSKSGTRPELKAVHGDLVRVVDRMELRVGWNEVGGVRYLLASAPTRSVSKPSVYDSSVVVEESSDDAPLSVTGEYVAPDLDLSLRSSVKVDEGVRYLSAIARTRSGELIGLNDHAHRVVVLNEEGKVVRSWGTKGERAGDLNLPTGVSINPHTEELFIAEFGNHRVQVFDSEGKHVRMWGKQGSARGEFDHPFGVCMDSEHGEVYVCDPNNRRVQVFDVEGSLRRVLTLGFAPACLAIRGQHMFITCMRNHEVHVLTRTGQHVRKWGKQGKAAGEFQCPQGIAVDVLGRVWVCDRDNHRVQVFGTEGTHLRTVDVPDREVYGICLCEDGRVMVCGSGEEQLWFYS